MNRSERRARAKEAERKGFEYMGIIKGFVKTVEVPNDAGKTVTIKMLSYFDLEAAREARVEKMREKMKMVAEFRAALPPRDPNAPQVARDPLDDYDVLSLLTLGVTAWTYDTELDVKLFTEATALFVAGEILRYSKPTEADLGKASSSSTGS